MSPPYSPYIFSQVCYMQQISMYVYFVEEVGKIKGEKATCEVKVRK